MARSLSDADVLVSMFGVVSEHHGRPFRTTSYQYLD
jgi:hypothetical protein